MLRLPEKVPSNVKGRARRTSVPVPVPIPVVLWVSLPALGAMVAPRQLLPVAQGQAGGHLRGLRQSLPGHC